LGSWTNLKRETKEGGGEVGFCYVSQRHEKGGLCKIGRDLVTCVVRSGRNRKTEWNDHSTQKKGNREKGGVARENRCSHGTKAAAKFDSPEYGERHVQFLKGRNIKKREGKYATKSYRAGGGGKLE